MADENQLENLKLLIDNFWKTTVYSIKDFDPLNKKKKQSTTSKSSSKQRTTTELPIQYNSNNPLPLARIKKIMKVDPQVKFVSQEVPILVGKITEIFTQEFSLRASFFAKLHSKKTISVDDYKLAMCHSELYDFLIDVVPLDDRFRLSRLNNDYATVHSNVPSAKKSIGTYSENKNEMTTANTTLMIQTPKSLMAQSFTNQENDVTDLFFNLNNNENINDHLGIIDNIMLFNTNRPSNSPLKMIDIGKNNCIKKSETIKEEPEPFSLASTINTSSIKTNNY